MSDEHAGAYELEENLVMGAKHTAKHQSVFRAVFPAVVMLCFIHCAQEIAGTSSDTDTGVKAMVLNPDLTPAVNAEITVYNFRDTSVAHETQTDENGVYSLSDLSGNYSIWAEKDSFVAFQDSVFLSNSIDEIPADTLNAPGSFKGAIEMEIGDPPTAVTVHALGTHIFANVSDNGWFTLRGLAEGEYVLRFSCNIPFYTTTYSDPVMIESGVETVHETPFRLTYSGIPYVEGIQAEFDTLNSVITVSWARSEYDHLQSYVIYRREAGSGYDRFIQHFITRDTIFNEQILFESQSQSPFGSAVPDKRVFHYKVVIRDNFENEGRSYGYTEVAACRPDLVKTSLYFDPGDAARTLKDRPVTITCQASNPTRSLRKIVWRTHADGKVIKTTTFESSRSISDSIRYTPVRIGVDSVVTEVEDAAGTITRASLPVRVLRAMLNGIHPNDTIAGVKKLQIQAISTVENVTVTLDGVLTDSISLQNGTAEYSFDTRIYYPTEKLILKIGEGSTTMDSVAVYLRNTDPVIGCWISENDSLISECYRENGEISSTRGIGWLLGWRRYGNSITLLQASGADITFIPEFITYDHCYLDGVSFVRKQ